MATIILSLYLALSSAFTFGYNTSDEPWKYSDNRFGLLVASWDEEGMYMLSPFNNYCDNYLFGIQTHSGKLRVFSDGLDNFGKWEIYGWD